MRIVVTKFGDNFIKSFAEDYKEIENKKQEKEKIEQDIRDHTPNKNFFKNSGSNFYKTSSNFNKSSSNFNKSHSNFGKDFRSRSGTHSQDTHRPLKAKEIHVNVSKVNMNRNLTDKYNSKEDLVDSILLPDLPKALTKRIDALGTDRNVNTPLHRGINTELIEVLPLKDVIKSETLKKLFHETKEKEILKNKNTTVTERDFRTPFEGTDIVAKIKKKIEDTKIVSSNIKLIEYIYNKDHISKILLEKIHSINEEEQWRLNKICQKSFNNNYQEMMHNNILSNKLKAKINQEKIDYSAGIKQMEGEVLTSKDILQTRDIRRLNKEDIFDKKIKLVHKIWDKYNCNRFYHRKSQNISSSTTLK